MKTVVLQQFFYGRDSLRDYCVLADSTDDAEMVNGVRGMCEAYQSPLAGGLPAPVLMTRVAGRFVLFDCIRNGLRDPAGRGTIFHHVLVAEADSLKETNIDAFGLYASGRFAERLPEPKARLRSVSVEAEVSQGTSEIQVKLPAAIETESSDIELFKRILGRQSNRVSWVTYASRDMPGFDLIGVPPGTRTSVSRWRYDDALNVIARPTFNAPATHLDGSDALRHSSIDRSSSPLPPIQPNRERADSGSLMFSIILNCILALACVWAFARNGKSSNAERVQNPGTDQAQLPVVRQEVASEDLRKQLAQRFDEEHPDGRLTTDEMRSLTEESGPFYQFTDKGWRELHEKQQEKLSSIRLVVLKMFEYVEFMNKSVLGSRSEAEKSNKEQAK